MAFFIIDAMMTRLFKSHMLAQNWLFKSSNLGGNQLEMYAFWRALVLETHDVLATSCTSDVRG